MNDSHNIVNYSMIGIIIIFFVVLFTIPSGITGNSLRDLFSGVGIPVGDCKSPKYTCPANSFCSALLEQSPDLHLKGDFTGACLTKYPEGIVCTKDYECQSNYCAGINTNELKSKLSAPQIGGCTK